MYLFDVYFILYLCVSYYFKCPFVFDDNILQIIDTYCISLYYYTTIYLRKLYQNNGGVKDDAMMWGSKRDYNKRDKIYVDIIIDGC